MPIDKLDIPLVIVEAIRPELARFCYYLENNKDKYPEIFNEKWKDQTEHQQLNYMIMLYFDIYVKNEFKKTFKLLKSRGVTKKLLKNLCIWSQNYTIKMKKVYGLGMKLKNLIFH